jgi:molybdopterin molybdotransferase
MAIGHFAIPMLTVAEAHERIARCVGPLAPVRMKFTDALGLRLAEDVVSQVDSPPFDKALLDGFAISTADESTSLREIEMVAAGGVAKNAVSSGATIRIMTGAPVPAGADAVVAWEDCQSLDEQTIQNPARKTKPGAGILKRGTSFHRGQVVLKAGKQLGPLDIALLAEIGQAEVMARPRPRVAVLPTGDELVEADEPLGPGQIRNSNGPMLLAALKSVGVKTIDLGVGRDDPIDLKLRIARGLECDVLLVSGGVSAGVKDLVPSVLADLGVKEQFHKLKMKPGKPLWFGVREKNGRQTLVFGLPGNPVSTLVSFRLFVLPALEALAGVTYSPPATKPATLAKAFNHRSGRPTYFPCRRVAAEAGEQTKVEPLDWKGSADLATLTRADCLAALPPGDYELTPGDTVEILPL